MRTILLLLLLSIPVYSQNLEERIKTFRNHSRFSVKYDKFKDQTQVSVGAFVVDGLSFRMSAYFLITDVPPRNIYLVFRSLSRDWKFLKNSDLYALVNGERFSLGSAEQDSDVRRYGVKEIIQYEISLETFERLAKATHVELKIGPKELTLKDEHLEAFRDLVSLTK